MKNPSTSDILRFGWDKTRDNFGLVLSVILVMILFGMSDHAIHNLHYGGSEMSIHLLRFFLTFALAIIGVIVGINTIKQGLVIVRGGEGNLRELLSYPSEIWKYIGGQILSMFLIIAGLLCFIIPGIVILIRLMFLKQILVDQKLGIIDSFTKAFDVTRGHTKDLFLFLVTIIVFNLAGALFFLVGLVVTVPITFFGVLYLYERIKNEGNG